MPAMKDSSEGSTPRPDPTERTIEMVLRELKHRDELVTAKFEALGERIKERFDSVDKLNEQQESSVENTRRDVKLAVDAAFNAAKEGVSLQDKNTGEKISEIKTAFTKQIDQMSLLNQTEIRAINDKLDDAKGRLQIIESRANGSKEGIGMIGAIVLGAFGVLGTLTAVAALIFAVTRRTI